MPDKFMTYDVGLRPKLVVLKSTLGSGFRIPLLKTIDFSDSRLLKTQQRSTKYVLKVKDDIYVHFAKMP